MTMEVSLKREMAKRKTGVLRNASLMYAICLCRGPISFFMGLVQSTAPKLSRPLNVLF